MSLLERLNSISFLLLLIIIIGLFSCSSKPVATEEGNSTESLLSQALIQESDFPKDWYWERSETHKLEPMDLPNGFQFINRNERSSKVIGNIDSKKFTMFIYHLTQQQDTPITRESDSIRQAFNIDDNPRVDIEITSLGQFTRSRCTKSSRIIKCIIAVGYDYTTSTLTFYIPDYVDTESIKVSMNVVLANVDKRMRKAEQQIHNDK